MLDTVANTDNITQYNPFKNSITILRQKSSKKYFFLSLKMIPWQYSLKKYNNSTDSLVVSTITCCLFILSALAPPPSALCFPVNSLLSYQN